MCLVGIHMIIILELAVLDLYDFYALKEMHSLVNISEIFGEFPLFIHDQINDITHKKYIRCLKNVNFHCFMFNIGNIATDTLFSLVRKPKP